MGLRDADTGKILWQGNDDLLVLEDSEMQSSVKVDLDLYLDQMWLIMSVCYFVIGNAHIDRIQGNQFYLGGAHGKV